MAPMDWHVSIVQKDGKGPMSAYPQVHVRMATIGLPLTTVTIRINEDSLATVASQLDMLERLIAQYGAKAFWGEPDAVPPRQTA
jgi:hypothetical protein